MGNYEAIQVIIAILVLIISVQIIFIWTLNVKTEHQLERLEQWLTELEDVEPVEAHPVKGEHILEDEKGLDEDDQDDESSSREGEYDYKNIF